MCTLLALALLASTFAPTTAARADDLSGRWVTLRSVNQSQSVVHHRNFLGELTPLANDGDRKDAWFRVVSGLGGPVTVSFEAANYPGHFLRHQASGSS